MASAASFGSGYSRSSSTGGRPLVLDGDRRCSRPTRGAEVHVCSGRWRCSSWSAATWWAASLPWCSCLRSPRSSPGRNEDDDRIPARAEATEQILFLSRVTSGQRPAETLPPPLTTGRRSHWTRSRHHGFGLVSVSPSCRCRRRRSTAGRGTRVDHQAEWPRRYRRSFRPSRSSRTPWS